VVNQKLGVSALGLQRVLGLGSYRTAWSWLHKLRRGMVLPGRDLLADAVEVDESYIGGVRAGTGGRGAGGKAIVAIAVEDPGERAGRVRMRRIPNVTKDTLTREGRVAGGIAAPGSLGSRRDSLPSPGSSHRPVSTSGPTSTGRTGRALVRVARATIA